VTVCKRIVLALALLGCAARQPATVVFLSDFGTADDAVAICKGVMLGIEPRLRIVDLTHQVTPYAVRDAARLLAGTTLYYPPRTVFLAVVDPGVGGPRRALVVASGRGQYFVVPDNGLITLVAERDGVREAREIASPRWTAGPAASATFHGRDVFAPVAARVARGERWTEIGPPVASLVRITVSAARLDERGLTGEVVAVDGPYGNLLTNVDAETFAKLGYTLGETVALTLGTRELRLPFARTFGDVPGGAPLLYVDSRGRLALAVNQGDFARQYDLRPPLPLAIPRAPR
jgi:hypothetical protein